MNNYEKKFVKHLATWAGDIEWKENGMRTDATLNLYVRGITECNTQNLQDCIGKDYPIDKINDKIAEGLIEHYTDCVYGDVYTLEEVEWEYIKEEDCLHFYGGIHLAE